jgi:two-component system CheB/CheR fusion protein
VSAGRVGSEDLLDRLRAQVRISGGIDLVKYKDGVFLRRLDNRMKATRCRSLAEYVDLVEADRAEAERLTASLTIQVSSFFRDLTAFHLLEEEVIPALLSEREAAGSGHALKIWSAGCAHGEEAYTLAIILHRLRRRLGPFPASLLATDVNPNALRRARLGEYESRSLSGLSQEMLNAFFDVTAVGWRVKPFLRDAVRFKVNDLLGDPPGHGFDIIACRNVLIYLTRDMQEEVLRKFHSLLKPGGYLILGKAETTLGESKALYETISLKARVFRTFPGTTGVPR